MRIISAISLKRFKLRYPALTEFGMLNDDYAIAVLGADKLRCRPGEVRVGRKRRDGSVEISRIIY